MDVIGWLGVAVTLALIPLGIWIIVKVVLININQS